MFVRVDMDMGVLMKNGIHQCSIFYKHCPGGEMVDKILIMGGKE